MLGAEVERVLKTLEYKVTVLRTVAVPPQGRQCQRMGGVVCEIKAALEGERGFARVGEPGVRGARTRPSNSFWPPGSFFNLPILARFSRFFEGIVVTD
jgi:hypothetical protein